MIYYTSEELKVAKPSFGAFMRIPQYPDCGNNINKAVSLGLLLPEEDAANTLQAVQDFEERMSKREAGQGRPVTEYIFFVSDTTEFSSLVSE